VSAWDEARKKNTFRIEFLVFWQISSFWEFHFLAVVLWTACSMMESQRKEKKLRHFSTFLAHTSHRTCPTPSQTELRTKKKDKESFISTFEIKFNKPYANVMTLHIPIYL
jgi:hypothetical protein